MVRAGAGCGSTYRGHEARTGDQRGELPARIERHAPVVARVEGERRAAHALRRLADVYGEERADEAHRVLGGRRLSLQLGKRVQLLEGGAGNELRGKHGAIRGILTAPAHLHQLQLRLELRHELRRQAALAGAARVGAEQHEMRDALRIARRIFDRDRPALRVAEEPEALESGGVDDRFQIVDVVLEAALAHVPVRQAASARIHAHQRAAVRELFDPRTPQRALAFVFQVGQPVGRAHQRRPVAARGVGDARAVEALAEPNLLLHPREVSSTARFSAPLAAPRQPRSRAGCRSLGEQAATGRPRPASD